MFEILAVRTPVSQIEGLPKKKTDQGFIGSYRGVNGDINGDIQVDSGYDTGINDIYIYINYSETDVILERY